MDVVDLLQNNDWKKTHSGFRVLPRGRVKWTDVYMDGERKRIRISRQEPAAEWMSVPFRTFVQYVIVQTKVELVK